MKYLIALPAVVLAMVLSRYASSAPTDNTVSSKAAVSSSIITFFYEHFQTPGRCVEFVEKAAKVSGSDRLMFVPTLYFHDTNTTAVWKDQLKLDYLCYEAKNCTGVSKENVTLFENNMKQCFGRAIELGFNIAVTPHLDDARQSGLWRNGLVFSPETPNKDNSMSYYDAVLSPLINALNAVRKPDTKIWFGLQGEMSACVFMRPKDWQLAGERVRKEFGNDKNVKVGVSTNFDKLCHCLHVDEVDTGLFLQKFKRDFDKVKHLVDKPALRRLYESLDFFGISSYPSLTPDFQTFQLESAAREFDEEMQLFGIDIRKLIDAGKELMFAEYGLGGGHSQHGNVTAKNAVEVAKTPFFTIFDYNATTNPWDAKNAEVVQYRHHFFEETIKFLSGRAPGAHYLVSAVYNWNLGAYDFQGITNELAFDRKIAEMVKQHNLQVSGKGVNNERKSSESEANEAGKKSPNSEKPNDAQNQGSNGDRPKGEKPNDAQNQGSNGDRPQAEEPKGQSPN